MPSEITSIVGAAPAVPTDLSASAWRRWRAQHPPPWLDKKNRRGVHCGFCGEPLTLVTRICVACYEADR